MSYSYDEVKSFWDYLEYYPDKALEKGRPITEEDIDEAFPLADDDGFDIIY